MDASARQAWLGAGSNLGDRRAHLERAILWMRKSPFIDVVAVSSWRETEAIGPPQPDYLNGVIHIETSLSPLDLLTALKAYEKAAGRVRGVFWGPRPLDLDVLMIEDLVLETSVLQIPHPRLSTRRFVLEPLVELAPHLKHPVLDRTMSQLLEALQS